MRSQSCCLILLLASLALAGCGATSTVRVSGATTPSVTVTPSITPTETATSVPTPTETATAVTSGPSCASSPTFASAMRAGDLLLTTNNGHQGLGPYAYPGRKLPDGTPLKPLQVQDGSSTAGLAVPTDPPTNPTMPETAGLQPGGYEVDVCNASASQAHIIQGVTARIDTFAPYSGALNEWGACAGIFDASTMQASGGGCGGGPVGACEYFHATFTATAGASIAMSQVGSGRDNGSDGGCPQFGPLPVSLASGSAMSINMTVTAPTAPGMYTFAFAIVADGASSPFVAELPTLFAPVAHAWTGPACAESSMRAQIPATTVATYYVCPA